MIWSKTMLAVAALLLAVQGLGLGQDKSKKQPKGWAIDLPRGSKVTVKVPFAAMTFRYLALAARFGGEPTFYSADVESNGASITVNGASDWRSKGFPSMAQALIKDAKLADDYRSSSKGAKNVVIQLASSGGFPDMVFYIKPSVTDVNAAFRQLVALGGTDDREAVEYREQAYSNLASSIFVGPLASVPGESRKQLLLSAGRLAPRGGIAVETYKDKRYLVLKLGVYDGVFNTLRMTQTSRVARVVNELVLGIQKALAKDAASLGTIYGLKIEVLIPFKDFSDELADPLTDRVQIYTPLDLIRQFVQADITSQGLIDGSVLIVNDNRIQVSLSEQR